MQTYGNPNITYDWYAGNSGVTNRSGKFIAAHAAHAGLMMFWAGAFTLFELARYDAAIPMGNQGLICLPHLATLGIGGIENGVITDFYECTVIGVLHLIFSGVLGAGGLLHSLKFEGNLSEANGRPKKFDFKWDDPDKLTFILGHHLIFLGLGATQFVEFAKYHGIWDSAKGVVRTIEPNLSFAAVWNHQADFLSISSLEDVMGGHAIIALITIAGGAFHIATKQFGEYTSFKGKGLLSAESVLSYSLAGAGYMALIAAFWCSTNTTVYPTEFYGEVLKLNFEFFPYFTDTAQGLTGEAHTARAWLANAHFFLGFFFIQGHLWHALRGMGFDFKRISKALDNFDTAKITAGD
ncbi:chlorophyll a/b binding light-harvesting protein [Prochlorococcus sp. MIT 1341]|uniref:chlorophyll a/b binding light-harvesting protein n=1 Tax=Prochlorococcus sp. MIT 1341 TaxID=3096221 RepID=UPI002A757B09|nr:chlorophyll a/b binding light-harvesting protein [Prochlorococcus sp. MIT 1341]